MICLGQEGLLITFFLQKLIVGLVTTRSSLKFFLWFWISFYSHTLLAQIQMIMHCLKTWSYSTEVCNKTSDWWLATHICVFFQQLTCCMLIPQYGLKCKTGLTGYCFCIQETLFDPCERSGSILTACLFTLVVPVIKEVSRFHHILIFKRYFICEIGKGVRKAPSHKWDQAFSAHVRMSLAYLTSYH